LEITMNTTYLAIAALTIQGKDKAAAEAQLQAFADEAEDRATRLCLLGAIVALTAGAFVAEVAEYLRNPETV